MKLQTAERRVRAWMKGSRLADLERRGEIRLRIYPDGDGFGFHFSPDDEAPAEIKAEFEECTTSYVHADGMIEAYV